MIRLGSIGSEAIVGLYAAAYKILNLGNALADRLVVLLYTEVYAEAVPILQLLSGVLLLRFLSPFLSHILFARGEQARSLQVAVIGLAIHLALAFWLIPAYGASGAALALQLSATVGF